MLEQVHVMYCLIHLKPSHLIQWQLQKKQTSNIYYKATSSSTIIHHWKRSLILEIIILIQSLCFKIKFNPNAMYVLIRSSEICVTLVGNYSLAVNWYNYIPFAEVGSALWTFMLVSFIKDRNLNKRNTEYIIYSTGFYMRKVRLVKII